MVSCEWIFAFSHQRKEWNKQQQHKTSMRIHRQVKKTCFHYVLIFTFVCVCSITPKTTGRRGNYFLQPIAQLFRFMLKIFNQRSHFSIFSFFFFECSCGAFYSFKCASRLLTPEKIWQNIIRFLYRCPFCIIDHCECLSAAF